MRIAHLDGSPYLSLTIPSKEPLCVKCDKPIRWCLDLFTFTDGAVRMLAHARCVRTKAQLEREAQRR